MKPGAITMDVYVLDASDSVIRRWVNQQANAGGVIELSLPLADQTHYGIWKIKAVYQHQQYFKSFTVEEYCKSSLRT